MRRPSPWLIAVTALSLLLLLLIVTDWWPALRGPAPETSEWYWPYRLRPIGRWWAVLVPAVGLAAAGWWWLGAPAGRRRTALGLALLAGLHLALQAGAVYADRGAVSAELVDRTLAPVTSGYFWTAAHIDDFNATLRDYPAQMPRFASEHARTHPPGLVWGPWATMAWWDGRASAETVAASVYPLRCTDLWLLDRPPSVAAALLVWSVLPLLAAAATVPLAYWAARRVAPFADPFAARVAAVLTAAIPSLALFAPQSDQFFAPLMLLALGLLVSGVDRIDRPGGLAALFGAGAVLSLATFLSLGNAAFVVVCLVVAVARLLRRPPAVRRLPTLAAGAAAFGVGCLALWLVYWAGWGVPPWAVARVGLDQHYTLVTRLRRYDWWLRHNLLDLVVWAGLPLVAGWLALSWRALRRRRLPDDRAALGLGLLLLIGLLTVSGSARGEVGRLWLFAMPALAVAAAGPWSASRGRARLALLLQVALLAGLALSWRPLEAVLVTIASPPLPVVGTPSTALDAVFGDGVALSGFDRVDSAETVTLTLYWQADRPMLRPYAVFLHLVDSSGAVVAQRDGWPVDNQWPPTCWQPGQTIVDTRTIDVSGVPPGRYDLRVGWYDQRDLTRLPVTGPEPSGDSVRLGSWERELP